MDDDVKGLTNNELDKASKQLRALVREAEHTIQLIQLEKIRRKKDAWKKSSRREIVRRRNERRHNHVPKQSEDGVPGSPDRD